MLCHEWWLSQHFTHRCWAVCVTRERTWVAIHWLAATKSAKLPWFMWWYYPWRRFIPAVLRRWVVIKDNWPMLSFCFLIFRLCTIAHFNRNTICVLLLSFPLYLLHWTHFMVWWSCGLRDFWPFSSFVIQVWSQQEKSVLEIVSSVSVQIWGVCQHCVSEIWDSPLTVKSQTQLSLLWTPSNLHCQSALHWWMKKRSICWEGFRVPTHIRGTLICPNLLRFDVPRPTSCWRQCDEHNSFCLLVDAIVWPEFIGAQHPETRAVTIFPYLQ